MSRRGDRADTGRPEPDGGVDVLDDAAADDFDDGGAESGRRGRRSRRPRNSPVTGWPVRRIALWAGPVVGALLVLAGVAWFTPVLAVRTVEIEGLRTVPEEQVRSALQVPDGLSMWRIDTDAMAHRVAAIPKIHTARVQRVFPSTVRVTVEERASVLFFDSPQGPHLLDGDGVEFAIEPPPPGVPKLTTAHPGGSDPVTRAAVEVLQATPPALRAGVGEVVARSVSDIELNLRDGRTVLWGGAEDSARKAAVVLPVLTRPGTVFDVSSPDLVTVK